MSESDEQQQNGVTGGKGAAAKRAYRISLDGGEFGVPSVGLWEAEHATTSVFCVEVEGERHPIAVEKGDLLRLATVDATDRDAAVGILLKGEDPRVRNDRCEVVRAAWAANVNIDWVTPAESALGVVPGRWTFEPIPSIGAR
jgi:hypothetical protein